MLVWPRVFDWKSKHLKFLTSVSHTAPDISREVKYKMAHMTGVAGSESHFCFSHVWRRARSQSQTDLTLGDGEKEVCKL